MILGIPAVITTDQGKEFHDKLNKGFEIEMGIDHRLTTAYHPQANGLDEKFNQTMKNSIAKFSHAETSTWDVKILHIVYAYNTSIQDSTHYSPFQAMFGRIARLPIDINTDKLIPESKLEKNMSADSPAIEQVENQRTVMEEDIKKNIEKAQAKQSQYYDIKHGAGLSFIIGTLSSKKTF